MSNSPYISPQGKQPDSSKLNDRIENKEKQPPFSYFEGSITNTTPYVNKDAATWIVILGFDVSAANLPSIFVKSVTGVTIDAVKTTQLTAAGLVYAFSKKMLVPPLGSFNTANTQTIGFQALQGSFQDVIKYI